MSIYKNSMNSFFSMPLEEKSLNGFEPVTKLSEHDVTVVTSCNESLGFESCEQMSSSLDDSNQRDNYKESSSSSSSSSLSPMLCYSGRKENKWRSENNFPPPLTSLSENGRRNFTLKPTRKDGRLEIVGVMIERPEILCASRKNGRLRLHLVQTAVENVEDDELEVEEDGEVEGEVGVAEEEEVREVVEDEVEAEEEEEEEEERDQWRVVMRAASRRCYHMREMQVWGQQHRYVTSM